MHDHITRRPMPIEQSILWKPLNDSHYVVASLQASDGGRRKIFIRQRALSQVQSAARALHGRRVFGLLLGHFYQGTGSGENYLVIDAATEQTAISEDDVAAGIERALVHPIEDKATHVAGWYRSVPSVDARPSAAITGLHRAHFEQPWQTVLVVAEGAHSAGGAFFLNDAVNSRWFYTPFYELPDHMPAAGQPKSTCVGWPQYITSEAVVYNSAADAPTPQLADVPEKPRQRPAPEKWAPPERSVQPTPMMEQPSVAWSPLSAQAPEPRKQPALDAPATVPNESAKLADKAVEGLRELGLADVAHKPAEKPLERAERRSSSFGDRPVLKLPSVDDRDQRRASRGSMRLVTDDDDTSPGDEAARYIDVARAEGFFIAANFDARDETGQTEEFWVLNEPFSGFLLTVAVTGNALTDATLHYNLHTDEAGLRRTPFAEHRDAESHTIYVRETAIDGLRSKCQRLRATNALVREWKVSPPISFITPGEWESIAMSNPNDAREAVSAFNNTRIGELPDGVRAQFRLTIPAEPAT